MPLIKYMKRRYINIELNAVDKFYRGDKDSHSSTMIDEDVHLPCLWAFFCWLGVRLSVAISLYGIVQHLRNYRKPYEQRLILRILVLVPLFSLTCYIALLYPRFARLVTTPIREGYEAFVIFTFFSLLILILGGERNIITKLSLTHSPTKHQFFPLSWVLPSIDLSDPRDFLMVKRGVLQYVWLKPIFSVAKILLEIWDYPYAFVALAILYNTSVTWSFYNLAMFWKCLYADLSKFSPWSKFLCVKLIIFASFWQGILIQLFIHLGIISSSYDNPLAATRQGSAYQNGLLCVEMVFFAILHLVAFPWQPYSSKSLPTSGKLRFIYALKDSFIGKDVKWDFKHAFLLGSEYYTYENFRSLDVDDNVFAKMHFESRERQLKMGIRFTNNGKDRFFIPNYGSTNETGNFHEFDDENNDNEEWDDSIAGQRYIPDDPNYPVVWDIDGYRFNPTMEAIRQEIESNDIN